MKKYLYTIASVLILGIAVNAQEKPKEPEPPKDKGEEFDKKFRFGLRVAAQPTWFTSNQNNNKPYGANFGTGFGLNMEFRMSKIVAFSTGIGADFEGGKYTFRRTTEKDNYYEVRYWQKKEGGFAEPENGKPLNFMNNENNTMYVLKDRSIKTTHVTLPALLKLSTSEYSGMKYFGMFGAEIGIRVKAAAKDSYYTSYTYDKDGLVIGKIEGAGESEQANINLNKDMAVIPIRAGFNAGLGAEYRLGGSTAFFFSFNYFRSFTNTLRGTSKYMASTVVDSDPNSVTYKFVEQNYLLNAIRINVGILF
jgi:Outer membrane protein beta-barrel domain